MKIKIEKIKEFVNKAIKNLPYNYEILDIKKEDVIDLVNGEINALRVAEDYHNFKPFLCNDGGCYGYWVNLYFDREQKFFYIKFFTTSDFEYCSQCGQFGHTDNYKDELKPHEDGWLSISIEEVI